MNFFVSLLIISPVFISIGSGFNIAFDRSGGGPSSFIMSIPLSLIVVIAMVFLLYKNIIIDIIRYYYHQPRILHCLKKYNINIAFDIGSHKGETIDYLL